MSWILSDEHFIDFDINSKAIEKLLDTVNTLLRSESASLEELLEKIAAGSGLDLDDKIDTAAQKLAEKYLSDEIAGGVAGLARLRKRLWKIEEGAEAGRTFGWPSLKGELGKDLGDFSFSVNAEGGVSFEVLEGSADDDESKVKVKLFGSVKPKFSGKLEFTRGSIGGGAEAVLERSLTYLGAYDDDVRSGRALADALSRVGLNISDFDSVRGAFNKPAPHPSEDEDGIVPLPLTEIVYAGRQGLAAKLEGSAKVPVKAVTIKGSLKTAIELGGNFKIKVRRKDANTLILEAVGGDENERSFELGLGASVGLSALSPNFATDALNQIQDVSALFDKIDAVFDDVETWLKPGSAIKPKLAEFITDKISGNTSTAKLFKGFLADVFGVGSGSAASDLAQAGASQLADLIDDSLTLFTVGDDETGAFTEILRSLSDSLVAQVADIADAKKVENELADILKKAKDHLASKLNDAVGDLDNTAEKVITDIIGRDPGELLQDLRNVLGKARAILDKVAKALGDSSLDAVAIEVGWGRSAEDRHQFSLLADINGGGADFYSQCFKNTSAAIERLLNADNQLPGVIADPEKSWLLDTFSRSSSVKWNISILGGTINASSAKLRNIKILKTLGGVGVVAGGGAEVENSFFSSEVKKFSFANVLTFGPVREAAPKIGIDLTHDDNNLKVREAEDVMSVFEETHLISDDTSMRVRNAVAVARQSVGGEKLPASLEISLGLPGRLVPALIRHAAGNFETTEIAARSLVATRGSRKKLDEQLENLNRLSERRLTSLMTLGPEIAPNFERSQQHYFDIVMQADAIAEMVGEEARRASQVRAANRANLSRDRSYWRNLVDARDGLEKAFTIMAQAQALMEEFAEHPDRNDEDVQKDFLKALMRMQKRIIKNVKPWLKPGWGGIFDRPPERAAELYIALREIAQSAFGARPAVIVGFDPKHATKKLFVGNAEEITRN